MKVTIFVLGLLVFIASSLSLSAASWENNEYQRKSRAFSDAATVAYEAGDYDSAADLARQAESYADLSAEFIGKMLLRSDAETVLLEARSRLSWAKEKKAEKNYPEQYAGAADLVGSADGFFVSEDYAQAKQQAEQALVLLSAVRETVPLPAFYKVDRWTTRKDCFWNISANPAVYGDPFLWRNLYKANKAKLPQPSNPDLMESEMLITIPSLRGEYREGIYDPTRTYEPYNTRSK